MRAPVYRNLANATQILGVSIPWDLPPMVLLYVGLNYALPWPNFAKSLLWLALVVLIKWLTRGHPEGHVRNFLLYLGRRAQCGGYLSAAARAPVPRFRFGHYDLTHLLPRKSP